jgi:hypothetical protein
MPRLLTWCCLLALSLGTGCAMFSSSRASEPHAALDLQVQKAPPADRDEGTRPTAPGPGYLWVAGYWDYLDGNYLWRSGHWLPNQPQFEYVRARYDFDGSGWIFHRPHWKRRPPASATVEASAK